MSSRHPRDLVGYAPKAPKVQWPDCRSVALSFVINYEEGAESSIVNGDEMSECLLSEIIGAKALKGQRNLNIESLYEYGSRAGFYRLHDMFTRHQLPVTVFACGKALELNPQIAPFMKSAGWEVASHGYRWLDYQNIGVDIERSHIRKTIEVHRTLLDDRPIGFYQGKPSINTRELVVENGFLYDNDSYADDLPYWDMNYGKPHLIIPYTLDVNDMRFVNSPGFVTSSNFYNYLTDTLKCLIEEGREHPKMMSVGLHCRLAGHPGRLLGLRRFVEDVYQNPEVWVCRRADIAYHWYQHYFPMGHAWSPEVQLFMNKMRTQNEKDDRK